MGRLSHGRTLFQAALLQSLILGHYDGAVPVKDLKGQGDFGIGTFDALNGELIMLEGRVYQVNGQGKVIKAEDHWKVPFADVFFFETDRTLSLKDISSLDELRERTDDFIKSWGPNYFTVYAFMGLLTKYMPEARRHSRSPIKGWMK